MPDFTEVTPISLRCGSVGPVCPAVFKTAAGTYLIIGRRLLATEYGLEDRVGADESIVEVPVGLLENIVSDVERLDDIEPSGNSG